MTAIPCLLLPPSGLSLAELAPDVKQHDKGDEEERQHQHGGGATATHDEAEKVRQASRLRQAGRCTQHAAGEKAAEQTCAACRQRHDTAFDCLLVRCCVFCRCRSGTATLYRLRSLRAFAKPGTPPHATQEARRSRRQTAEFCAQSNKKIKVLVWCAHLQPRRVISVEAEDTSALSAAGWPAAGGRLARRRSAPRNCTTCTCRPGPSRAGPLREGARARVRLRTRLESSGTLAEPVRRSSRWTRAGNNQAEHTTW